MEIAVFDIETVPTQNLPSGCRPEFDEDSIKYGNLKDETKRKAKRVEAEQVFNDGLDKKMATDRALCQVVCFVGYQYNTDTNELKSTIQLAGNDPDDEHRCVSCAWEFIHKATLNRVPVVTFNGKGFDLPVLLFRAMILDIAVQGSTYVKLTNKWNVTKDHYDLMQVLVGNIPQTGRNLDFYLRLFGVGAKPNDFDGSQVYETWQAKEYDKIREYCESDVLNTCQLFSRIQYYITV